MSVTTKPGTRLRSTVCDTQVAIIKADEESLDLRCGGRTLAPIDEEPSPDAAPEPPFDQGTEIGKRYTDADETVELLCTKGGAGSLSLGDMPLELKSAKPLPSSD